MPVERHSDGLVIDFKLKNSSLSLSLYGCTILSFTTSTHPLLFLSSKAILDTTKPIRGGIPLVFPQFGPGKLPQHGFARKSLWIEDSITESSTSITAVFHLDKTTIPKDQRLLWPWEFDLVYTIVMNDDLKTSLRVINSDSVSFKFTALLHTYLKRTKDQVIKGLFGVYEEFGRKGEGSGDLVVDCEIDRVYENVGDVQVGSTIIARSRTLPNVVVWNPWVDKARGMTDFGDEEYLEMVCVEPGVIGEVELEPGESWEGYQVISYRP